MYPPERTVLIMVASWGSGSILRRIRLTSTSMLRSKEPALRPWVRSSRLSRDSTRPGRSQKGSQQVEFGAGHRNPRAGRIAQLPQPQIDPPSQKGEGGRAVGDADRLAGHLTA